MRPGEVLSLALHVEGGRLFALLTDFRALSVQAWGPADDVSGCMNGPAAGPSIATGHRLPAPIVHALQSRPGGVLQVQLPPALHDMPIESEACGLETLGRRFAIARHLVLDATARPVHREPPSASRRRLRVGVVRGASAATPALAVPGDAYDTTPWPSGEPAPKGVFDVVVVPLAEAAGWTRQAHSHHVPPALWVWTSGEPGELDAVLALYAAGHAALLAPQGLDPAALAAQVHPFLEDLAGGAPPALALRHAAAETSTGGWRLYHAHMEPLCLPIQAPSGDSPPAEDNASSRAPSLDPAESAFAHNDHRLVATLSFDMVDSTALLTDLGAERYSDVLASVNAICSGCIARRDGVVDVRRGDDGSMAYFGIPSALEDAAERAIHAALAIRDRMRECYPFVALRFGVATGRVAVRDGQPFGPAVHLAARLRSQAGSMQIYVDSASRRLARHAFDFDASPGLLALKGVSGRVAAFRVAARSAAERIEPLAAGTPFVGREAELAELQHHWHRASKGGLVSLLIHGEAGVGKTRLVREFLTVVRAQGARFVEVRGSPETESSAFQALLDGLMRSRSSRAPGSAATGRGSSDDDGIARLAALLRGNVPGLAPPLSRERLLRSVATEVAGAAATEPLLLIFEDIQWVDPSTRDLLEHIVESAPLARLMLLCTRRDEAVPQPLQHRVEARALPGLSPASARRLVHEVAGDRLSPAAIDRLADRADGIPLFLEESARLACEAHGATGEAAAPVPDSLSGLLMARLDRLSADGKLLAQVAAVIGRESDCGLLERLCANGVVARRLASPLPSVLDQLVRAGVLRMAAASGAARVVFRHELLRDVAYQSLWKSDCARLHGAVADELLRAFGDVVAERPELLAYHLSCAGRHDAAVRAWERAARQAASKSAHREAIGHLRAALDGLAADPHGLAEDELRLQLLLARHLIAAEGYGAAEVERVYQRAAALVGRPDQGDVHAKVVLGLESVHVMRGELDRAAELAAQAEALAARLGDSALRLQARWAAAHVRFHAGDSVRALALMDDCLADYRPGLHRRTAVQDPGIMCLCYSAWGLWELGRADEAEQRIARVVSLAHELGHRFSLGEACAFAASVAMFRGDLTEGSRRAEQAIAVCEEAGFAVWLAHARVVRGRLWALQGQLEAGLQEMAAGCALWTRTGAAITRPLHLALIAETHVEHGEWDAAKAAVDEARALITRTGEHYHEAELLRLAGQVAVGRGDGAGGRALLDEAIDTAARQGKRAFALRSAMALGSVLALQGRPTEAIGLVGQALQPLTQGLDTRDPITERRLLAVWQRRLGLPL